MKHEGFRKDRLNHPDFSAKERAFAKEWADSVHTTPSSKGDYHILEALVPNATERDAAVAAAAVQLRGVGRDDAQTRAAVEVVTHLPSCYVPAAKPCR